jgi:hypothetical protein
MNSSGVEPAAFRLVTKRLNHLPHRMYYYYYYYYYYYCVTIY